MKADFVFVDESVSGIRWDAKYATWDNFTGKPVDGYVANRIVGTRALCAALERAREEAASLGFGLLLWDGYRPQRAVDCFLRWSKQPEDGRTKLRHYPNIDRAEMFEKGYVAAKSGHSRGSAVDLTLYHLATGELAPMGGDHDLMDSISHHGAKGITQVEARNRQYLCSIMEACGFSSYDCEWWHYTLKDEPYPDTYFDFPITTLSRPKKLPKRREAAAGDRDAAGAAYGTRPITIATTTTGAVVTAPRVVVAGGEQRLNAESVNAAGGALLVDNADLDPAWIETTLIPVRTDPERIAAMSAHASAAGAPDADVVLARHVLTAVAERRRFAS